MLELLYPHMYVRTLLEIPLARLKELQIKAVVFDLDNTVTEWNSNYLQPETIQWFSLVREQGFKACILSNNKEKRIINVAERLGIPFIHRAGKPSRKGYLRAVDMMNVVPREAAVIGDQIFTDILGGNRAGLFTILVVPISGREFPGTKISRFFEYFVLKKICHQLPG